MASSVPIIGAGAVLQVGDGATPTEVFTEVPQCVTIGEVGGKGEFVDATPISSLVKEFIAGMETPPDISLVFNDVPGNTAQAAFLVTAKARATRNFKIVYPNGRTAALRIVMAGYVVANPEAGKAMQVTVFGKQSGAETFTFSS